VWADRTDVSEELARLRAHLAQLAAPPGPATSPWDGRSTFLIQEINPGGEHGRPPRRDDLEISQTVIAAKATAREDARGRCQNIE